MGGRLGNFLSISYFGLINKARFANVVRLNCRMDKDNWLRLVKCLIEATKPSMKKQNAADISPTNEGDTRDTPSSRQPL